MRSIKQGVKRKVKVFGRSIPVLAIVAIVASAGMVSAALLSYYGKITMTADVKQSVTVDGGDYTEPISDILQADVPGGETFLFKHCLHNRASVPAMVTFETTPQFVDDEIVTTYWLPIEYSETFEVDYAAVTVENLECSVKWTIDMTEPAELYQYPFANGHAAVALIIGIGDEIRYQVHSNDGTCAAYDDGTWLLSFYDPTGGGWMGWHSSEPDWNTPVADYGIEATGERALVNNSELKYTITIPKQLLSCGEFKWALVLIGDDTFAKIGSEFDWSDEDTTNFAAAIVGEEIVGSLILPPCVDVDFIICHSFAMDIKPGTYTITTTVMPE